MRQPLSCAVGIVYSIAGLIRIHSHHLAQRVKNDILEYFTPVYRLLLVAAVALIPVYAQETTVTIDTPVNGQTYSGTQVFGGWAVDSGSPIANVVVMMDGVTPGQIAAYGTNRQDVCNVYVDYPGCPNVGWNYSVDTTQLANGWHYIRAWVTTADGRQTIQDATFYANNATASTINIDNPSYGNSYSGYVTFGGWAVDGASTISAVRVFIDGAPSVPPGQMDTGRMSAMPSATILGVPMSVGASASTPRLC